MQTRFLEMQKVETRSADDGNLYLEGYFVIYDSIYTVWPGATESIAKGALKGGLGGNVRALYNHNDDLVLGTTGAGTLELEENDYGLWGRIKINPKDSDAVNAYERVARGDVTGCSFGFDIPEDGEVTTIKDDGTIHWEIKEINPVYEVSPCVFPAYEATHINARSHDVELIRKRRLEEWKERNKRRLKADGTESPEAEEAD